MKKIGVRQMIASVAGGLTCAVGMMECYPLVPAYFAALYLEEVSGAWLMFAMYIGMLYFMPLTAVVKYGVTLVIIAGAIKLVQWANEGCPAYLAGILAAIAVLTLLVGLVSATVEIWRDNLKAFLAR